MMGGVIQVMGENLSQWVGNYEGEGISCIQWIKSRLTSFYVLPYHVKVHIEVSPNEAEKHASRTPEDEDLQAR